MTTFQDYTILRKLGEGSFGRTFLAEHAKLGYQVCLKQLYNLDDPRHIEFFQEEARLLAKVRHPYLPSLHGYWDATATGHGHVIALSYIVGESLEDVVKPGFVDDEHICWIMDRALTALSYLHYRSSQPEYDRGIVHCDIKPANILLNIPEHEAYLVDFGLAFAGPVKQSKARGGTELYMPPEFPAGKPPIPASDLYSLGKTAIFLAGGNVSQGTYPFTMAAPLREWIDKMIRHDPMARYQSADEARTALQRVRMKVFRRLETTSMFERRS